jgi:hypothetical protein
VTERGTAPIELALGVLVLLVPVALLVLSFGPVLERRAVVRSMAVDVARTIVFTDGDASGALERLAWRLGEPGVADAELHVGICGSPALPLDEVPTRCDVDRLGIVEVTVTMRVDVRLLPGGPASVSYTHTEPLDPYRSRG